MSSFIKMAGINPPATRPRVDRRDVLFPEQGALVLLEPSHPTEKWFSGIPTESRILSNLAAESLKSITKAADADISGSMFIRGLDNNVVLKRTSKGAINAVRVQGAGSGVNTGMSIRHPKAAIAHVIANPTHSYYISLWSKITENTDGTHAWSILSASTSRNEKEGYLYVVSNANTNYPNGPEKIGTKRDPNITRSVLPQYVAPTLPVNWFASIGVSSYANPAGINLTVDEAVDKSRAFGVGNFDPFGQNSSAAAIGGTFYRTYMEDLTISGRTYAEVEALDYAAYIKEVTKSGGRYYGDS